VLWDADGTPHDLGNPPGGAGNNVAVGINNRAQVTMNSVMSDGTIHAFVFANAVPQDLGTYPADAFMTVAPCCNNINNRGQIAGFSVDADGDLTALLWPNENSAPVDLNTLLPSDSPWFLLTPGGISDAGDIATTAFNKITFEVHAVLLSPIAGIGPAARGASKPPVLPASVGQFLQNRLGYSNRKSN